MVLSAEVAGVKDEGEKDSRCSCTVTSVSADVAGSSSLDVASPDVFLSHCCICKMLQAMSLLMFQSCIRTH